MNEGLPDRTRIETLPQSARPPLLTRRRVLATLAIVLAAAVIALLVPQIGYLQQVRHYAAHDPESTAFMDMRREELRSATGAARLRHEWVAYEDIAPVLVRAVVAAEDGGFMDHSGFAWASIRAAWEAHRNEDRRLRGASTITQQLAKNLFLSEERSYLRKLQEAVIAVMLERSMDKRRILEIYLNVIEWGDGVFGVEAAARHFHGVGAHELNGWQAAVLAARIPRPRFYDRHGETTFLIRRAARIQEWIVHTRIP